MSLLNELLDECGRLPSEIAAAAEAIVRYVTAVSGDSWVKDSSGKWRPVAENFITVKPQWKQAHNLAITIRGEPKEFEQSTIALKKDQNGYSAFRLEKPEQIADAFVTIRRAHALFERGRTRTKTTPQTIG